MKPIVKWVGGKTSSLPQILPIISPEIRNADRYIEPFIGGASVFLQVGCPEKSLVSDKNLALVSFYKWLGENPTEHPKQMMEIIECLPANEAVFLRARAILNEWLTFSGISWGKDQSVAFYTMMALGFNGLYRVNKSGLINTPFGKKDKWPKVPIERWQEVALAFSKAEIVCQDYKQALGSAKPNDFIYLDPPYLETFSSYDKTKFDQLTMIDLWQMLDTLNNQGVKWALSHQENADVIELFNRFVIHKWTVRRGMAAKGRSAQELLITNF